MSANLNYKVEGQGQPIVLIHGLFGNLDNLGLLARDLKQDHLVVSVDLRNHGESFHDSIHSYQTMADDVAKTLQSLNIDGAVVIGHSMGGKVTMSLTSRYKDLVEKQIIMDMSPVAYTERRHDNVFSGLFAVLDKKPTTRKQAMDILAQHIEIDGVRQFLGKSLYKNSEVFDFRFNVASLFDNYSNIMGWDTHEPCSTPTFFIKGGNSDYITAEHQPLIAEQFPNAKAHIIANTGHWLHAEKPEEVLRAIRKFINKTNTASL